jgi:hypothetical protein
LPWAEAHTPTVSVHLFRAVYWHSNGVVQRGGSSWLVWLVVIAAAIGAGSGLIVTGRIADRGAPWRVAAGAAGVAIGGLGLLIVVRARGQVRLPASGHGLTRLFHRIEGFVAHKVVSLSPGPGAYLLLAGGLLLIVGALIPPVRPHPEREDE